MRLDDAPGRGNVEDRRGMKPLAAGGGLAGLLIMAVIYFLTGDARQAKQIADKIQGPQGAQVQGPAPADGVKEFSEKIMAFTDDVWTDQFPKQFRQPYEKPTMVLFSEAVVTNGCGRAPSGVGPFYCPADRKVYIDPTFFAELEKRLGGSAADFSKAYVIAHEVGHHVQNLLEYNDLVESYRRREGENAGIRLELQADYLAGVCWHHVEKRYRVLEQGDVEAAITSAKAIGDDKLSGWRGNPEQFNHGTSAQRTKYFLQGLKTGDASKATLDRFFNSKIAPLDL